MKVDAGLMQYLPKWIDYLIDTKDDFTNGSTQHLPNFADKLMLNSST